MKRNFQVIWPIVILSLIGFPTRVVHAQSDEYLNVISNWLHYTDVDNSLYHHLAEQAHHHLDRRQRKTGSLNTKKQWELYQKEIRKTLNDIVGPFPERTPLNARTVDILDRSEFIVEKVIYESKPGFYVTAALFVPKGLSEPAPAIIYASGHARTGFRSPGYQSVIINLVKKGFVVLAFDPIGQGERLQYFDEKGLEVVRGSPTNEHSYPAPQTYLTGNSVARYMIWDGIRSVDYLLERNEVDPDRIGITGRSGGGTQAAYAAAFDDRIRASAPGNYLTSFEYLLKSRRGLQDAEQNFYHGIARGIDHADLMLAHAPKPALMITTTRDFFSIQGARNTFAELKRCYESIDQTDNIMMVEDDAGHSSTRANREAMYAFFQHHLDNPGSSEDLDVEVFSQDELRLTETGQVISTFGGETLFTLNARSAGEYVDRLKKERSSPDFDIREVKKKAITLSGYHAPLEYRSETFTGRYIRDGYALEMYYIQGEGEYPIPYLMFRPEQPGNSIVLYLHPGGKYREAHVGGEIEWLVKQGYTVVAPDLLGIGELGPGLPKGEQGIDFPRGDAFIDSVSYNIFFGAVQIGRSITGIRAGDINRLIHTVISKPGLQHASVILMGKDAFTLDSMHAAAFNELISGVILINPLISFESITRHKYYDSQWVHSIVPGALTAYDLQDLAELMAPRHMLYINPVTANGTNALLGRDAEDFETRSFRQQELNHATFKTASSSEESRTIVLNWLKNRSIH